MWTTTQPSIVPIRGIGVVFKWSKRPIFSFIIIQFIEMKHLFAKIFGRCADILTFNSEWIGLTLISGFKIQWVCTNFFKYSPIHYAPNGTFLASISQIFESLGVFEDYKKIGMSPFSKENVAEDDFSRIFKEALWLKKLTDLNSKGVKRSAMNRAMNLYNVISKNILFKVNRRP